jgi:hypothetical protein
MPVAFKTQLFAELPLSAFRAMSRRSPAGTSLAAHAAEARSTNDRRPGE